MKYHFICDECGFSDKEAEKLATERQIYCGICAGDGGDDTPLWRWKEDEPCPYPELMKKWNYQ